MTVTRRTFLATVAAAPLAAQSLLGSKSKVAVIGAGAFGGWTALALRKLGVDVVLIDAWGPGNSLSSSGGKTRVIRAIYGPDRIYSEMVKRAFELWSSIDSKADPLYTEMGALWMHRGDDAYVRAAVPILHDLGFAVDPMPVADAAKKYPQIDFNGVQSVWFERKAGALSSRHCCVVVRDAVEKAGGRYRQSSVKPGAIANGKMSAVQLQDGSKVEADAYVFACGPWLGTLFPDVIGDRVHPTRQEVYYFATPKGSDRYASSRLPIWIDFGKRIVYGIPDINGRWLKVADDTRGEPIDPTTADRHPKKEKIESAREFLAERFPEIARQPLLSAEVCQYENSPDGNLIIDRHPGASNVWLIGGGSGHGFKLSPVVGEMTAQAIVSGKEVPAVFHLDRLRDVAKPKTQFDIKKSS
jgi:glycine/D-amino acid oxidase-like deaminating enzyme